MLSFCNAFSTSFSAFCTFSCLWSQMPIHHVCRVPLSSNHTLNDQQSLFFTACILCQLYLLLTTTHAVVTAAMTSDSLQQEFYGVSESCWELIFCLTSNGRKYTSCIYIPFVLDILSLNLHCSGYCRKTRQNYQVSNQLSRGQQTPMYVLAILSRYQYYRVTRLAWHHLCHAICKDFIA